MSYFYSYDFISPQPLYAEVKEDLRSYFEAGLIDDMMFPLWTSKALEKLKKASYKLVQTVIDIQDYEGCLPEDFKSIREAWACSTYYSDPIRSTEVRYYETDCIITDSRTNSCDACAEGDTSCTTTYNVLHKVTKDMLYQFQTTFLLKPGSINATKFCGESCLNLNAYKSPETYDITNNKIITSFIEGKVYLVYYADNVTEQGDVLIPDCYEIKEYIMSFLRYKCFVQLFNQVTDETFNQVLAKKQMYEQEYYEKLILAQTELKKKTVEQKIKDIGKDYRRFNKYRL